MQDEASIRGFLQLQSESYELTSNESDIPYLIKQVADLLFWQGDPQSRSESLKSNSTLSMRVEEGSDKWK